MYIATSVLFDIETGQQLAIEGYDYNGPISKCDRALQQQATNAANTATTTAGQYNATAGSAGGFLLPQLERFTVNPPGYAPQDLASMETNVGLTGAAESGKAREEATLRAARTGNAAALPGQMASLTEAASRSTGGMIQGILAKNAALKAQQQAQAQKEIGSLYSTAAGDDVRALGLVPEDIKTAIDAGRSGWFQNILAAITALKTGGGSNQGGPGNGSIGDDLPIGG